MFDNVFDTACKSCKFYLEAAGLCLTHSLMKSAIGLLILLKLLVFSLKRVIFCFCWTVRLRRSVWFVWIFRLPVVAIQLHHGQTGCGKIWHHEPFLLSESEQLFGTWASLFLMWQQLMEFLHLADRKIHEKIDFWKLSLLCTRRMPQMLGVFWYLLQKGKCVPPWRWCWEWGALLLVLPVQQTWAALINVSPSCCLRVMFALSVS